MRSIDDWVDDTDSVYASVCRMLLIILGAVAALLLVIFIGVLVNPAIFLIIPVVVFSFLFEGAFLHDKRVARQKKGGCFDRVR